jgi:amino acid adenylation domain-containing protein
VVQGATLTYAELDSRADALAWRLRGLGVGPGSRVGLCVERSPEMVVGLLGILKAGGAYVPLDPGYPIDRLSFMVRDSRMTTLVTQGHVRAELPLEVRDVVLLESVEAGKGPFSDSGGATPNDPAYVIYTSGSTGTPKGVLVPHHSVVNFLASVREEPGITASDVLLAVTTLSFDIAVLELYLPLTVGARVVIASREVASDGSALLAAVRAHGVTIMQATPSTWRLLLAAGWSRSEPVKVLCGGEALPLDLARELVKRSPSVWNMYGPTETTVWSTRWRVDERVERVLIGKPLANTNLYVLDPRGQQVPTGVIGELFIGGAGVALGYHDRAQLTGERFVPDPFRGGGERMYKTGDLVRFLADGNVECLGRNDSQVKLRGFRIELGEIENALSQHPQVLQAVVIVREDRPGDARLVAYTALRPDTSASDTALRAHLKKTLPEYMLPQHFVHLDQIPVLPNGKVNRRALPPPDMNQARSEEGFVAPRTPTEEMLATIWQEVLAIGRVSVQDDFFALGGHSLLATQVIARLRRDRGLDVSFRKMFEAPTIEKLAALIDASDVAPALPQSRIVPRAGGSARLSIAQRRMWLLEEMDSAQRASHNLCASWRLDGALDTAALQRALDEIARRHEMLRANFVVDRGEPHQVVRVDRTISLRLVDLRDRVEEERRPALVADRDAQATIPFDLAEDPLIRVTLYKLADDLHVLSTVQHNIVWDGWSFDIFLRELSILYAAFARGEQSPLPSFPIAYMDFAEWQQDWVGSAEFEKAATFWRTQLADTIQPLDFPTDAPRKGTRSQAGASEGVHLSIARADALSAIARESGATLFMLVFAAYSTLLYRHTGQRDLLLGIPMRARTRPELEELIGPFVNVVALRTTVDASMTFLDLLEVVRERTLDGFGYQDVPIDSLGVRPPMLRALFSLQDARTRPMQLGEVRVTQEHALAPVAASELMLWAMESSSSLLLMLNFATDLFQSATARRLLGELDTLLEQIQRDPHQRVGSIPLLPADEREAIGRAGGDCAGRPTDDVLSVIHRSAEHGREAIAVQCEDRTLSYAQLLRRVQAFAGDLEARGVTTESRVGVRSEKADDRLVAILAVLAVGARCVLNDGEHPTLLVQELSDHTESDVGKSTFGRAVAYVDHGVAVLQAELAESLRSLAKVAEMRPGEIAVVSSRIDSANGICAALLPLVGGARLVLSPSDDPDALLATIAAAQPSAVLLASAATWRAIPEIRASTALVFGNPSVALRAKLADGAHAAFVVHVCAALGLPAGLHRVSSNESRRLLGRPLPGMRWRVIDTQGGTAPIGVSGELHIDFADESVVTGDRVRLLADGLFEHLGRRDGRVDLDGLVDLAQIAGALKLHSAVQDAWAAVRDDPAGDMRIVAYYVSRPGASYTETELRKQVREALGEKHVPRMFVELDALPRDAAGAVDDERLPSPYAVSLVHEYRGPRTDAEKYIASVWQEALGVARIGVHDNFFDLGGHSLLCFRVIARIERDTGRRVSPRVVLLNTLEQLATELEGASVDPNRQATAPRAGEDSSAERSRAKDLLGRLKGFLKR